MLITTYFLFLMILVFNTPTYLLNDLQEVNLSLIYMRATIMLVTYVSAINYYISNFPKGSLEIYSISTINLEGLLLIKLIKHWLIRISPLILLIPLSLLMLNQPINISILFNLIEISFATLIMSNICITLIGQLKVPNKEVVIIGFNMLLLIPFILLREQESMYLIIAYLLIKIIIGKEILRWRT